MIGKLLDYRYKVIKVLATGGFGENYIAEDTKRPGNPICVVKHLKPTSTESKVFDTAKRLFQSEAETLEKLGNHDQIPRLLAYFDENHEFFLVQEFIEGHPLTEELETGQRWNENQVIQMLVSVLSVLEFVHSQGVIHRDIKPDNIIRRYSDGKLVLVDFGAVKQLRTSYGLGSLQGVPNPSATVAIGTPGYMPTEQGQGRPRHNSDIYSLGIIAIQALTGIAPMDLPEDPQTGELLWENLVPVSRELIEVLNMMVRYHFKERYQNATEALEALSSFSHNLVPQQYPQLRPQSNPSAQHSRVMTIAVAPSHPRQPTQTFSEHQIPRGSSGPDFLQILIILGLVGGTAFATSAIVENVNNFGNSFTGAAAQANCTATVAANSNVRSEPSTYTKNNIIQRVSKDTKFLVTGKRTKKGWVEVKVNPGESAWAHSNVIKNGEEWITCLRDQSIAVKTVDGSGLIATPVPKPEPILKNEEESKSIENAREDDAAVEKAKEKYESGDLEGAIAILETLAPNNKNVKEAREMITQWQKDWDKAEGFFNDVNTAISQGKWEKVQEYQKNPDKLPDTNYWRKKVEPLFQQAAENTKNSLSQIKPAEAEEVEKGNRE
ncbi:serine/threonine protein kinase [Rivularia sp. PCC 7116]|uniref:serine/threonine protein kinase n=1 Tax=Rivularia sp. PCC 7116 TaxID=373994 RepID=UPI00029F3503|nr:serine/threonine protein kinase [Rivularia sp. PCC 7116]AFY57073.1 serine/threonine protein kinase [Rivularia sp. PCC 7116]